MKIFYLIKYQQIQCIFLTENIRTNVLLIMNTSDISDFAIKANIAQVLYYEDHEVKVIAMKFNLEFLVLT